MSTLLLYLALFGALFAIGAPVVLSLAVAAVTMLMLKGIDLIVFAQKFMVSMDNFGLTAMFFFILAGEIMNGGGMTRRIVAAVSKLVKGIPGGLAIVTLVSSAIFAAINGSAIATMLAIGAIMYPAMVRQGYSPAFSVATIGAGGVVGPIIPPSIPMIVYGSTTGDSVAALFMGGFLIGALIVAAEIAMAYWISKKHGWGMSTTDVEFGDTRGIVWALVFPVMVMASIVSGMMTPTETASMAVMYAWFVGAFIYKEFRIRDLPAMTAASMKGSAAVMAIVGAATAVGWILTYERVPQQITEALVATISSPFAFIAISFGILFIVGMIMDLTPAILILTPIFVGPVVAFGVDPIYFGVFFCSTLTAGLITPPVGTLIYLGCSMSQSSLSEVVKELLPYIAAVYAVLFLSVAFPEIITYLPKTVLQLYGS
ncbi:MAG: TRAP transporter large permease [Candidatus Accumulibacter sp.]|jgi:C4-dicarboxylate transporter DctM subunit|nr:TRAP transporter large permease [Accumulibacter sp.]